MDRIGGWNPSLGKLQGTLRTGEDHEFALRMAEAGFVGVYEPRAFVHHRVPADRLRLAYFHRWFYDNGIVQCGLDREYPRTTRYLMNVPRYLWRQVLMDAVLMVRGMVTLDAGRAVAGEMRLAWFAGYVRGCWNGWRAGQNPRLNTSAS